MCPCSAGNLATFETRGHCRRTSREPTLRRGLVLTHCLELGFGSRAQRGRLDGPRGSLRWAGGHRQRLNLLFSSWFCSASGSALDKS